MSEKNKLNLEGILKNQSAGGQNYFDEKQYRDEFDMLLTKGLGVSEEIENLMKVMEKNLKRYDENELTAEGLIKGCYKNIDVLGEILDEAPKSISNRFVDRFVNIVQRTEGVIPKYVSELIEQLEKEVITKFDDCTEKLSELLKKNPEISKQVEMRISKIIDEVGKSLEKLQKMQDPSSKFKPEKGSAVGEDNIISAVTIVSR